MIMLNETGGGRGRSLKITSADALDAAVADVVRLKIELTRRQAERDAELAEVEKRHTAAIMAVQDRVAELEEHVREYCEAHREELFPSKKSRETGLAVFGFEFTPWRVATARRMKVADVIKRLGRTLWGRVYVRTPTKLTLDKDALLKDREKLTEAQLAQVGLRFERDEQFFIRPKPETAEASVGARQ
ncbi:MAG TPA: host-nuclease inhibitor Gam family protein [Kiritimatiellia bacterium]|nr:host-nuclease inhibitor Gam family protein [Kiritimatiellia bacterium]